MRRSVSAIAALVLIGSIATPAQAGTQTGTISWVPPCAVACSYWVENGFEPCSNDFPPGTYASVALPVIPAGTPGTHISEVVIFPYIDWDGFICGPTGDVVATGVNLLWGPCDGLGVSSQLPVGCREYMTWVAAPGAQYTLLAYNWSDTRALPYRYTGYTP